MLDKVNIVKYINPEVGLNFWALNTNVRFVSNSVFGGWQYFDCFWRNYVGRIIFSIFSVFDQIWIVSFFVDTDFWKSGLLLIIKPTQITTNTCNGLIGRLGKWKCTARSNYWVTNWKWNGMATNLGSVMFFFSQLCSNLCLIRVK